MGSVQNGIRAASCNQCGTTQVSVVVACSDFCLKPTTLVCACAAVAASRCLPAGSTAVLA